MTFVSHDTMKMFDRAAQRERARQFEQAQLAAGAVRPAPMAIPITAKPAKMPWSPSSLGSTVVPKAKKAAKTSWFNKRTYRRNLCRTQRSQGIQRKR